MTPQRLQHLLREAIREYESGEIPDDGNAPTEDDYIIAYIQTGYFGALDPDKNEHLVPYHEKFLAYLSE